MEKLLESISQLRHVTEWSQPNMKFDETMALINELEEEIKNPKQPEILSYILMVVWENVSWLQL